MLRENLREQKKWDCFCESQLFTYVTFQMICFGGKSGQKNAVNLPQNVFYFPKGGCYFMGVRLIHK